MTYVPDEDLPERVRATIPEAEARAAETWQRIQASPDGLKPSEAPWIYESLRELVEDGTLETPRSVRESQTS